MNTHTLPFPRFLKSAAIVAIIVGSTLGVGGQRHRAKVSSDLLSFEARRTSARARVIVRGSRMEIEARARRGTMYQPMVVDTFIRVHRELVEQMASFPPHDALRQITRSAAGPSPAPAAMVVAPDGVSDDILAFVSLARLASGDASMGDVLSLASGLMRELAPAATIGWFVIDDGSGCLAMRHASGPAAPQMQGTVLRLGEGVSGWVAANRQVIINSAISRIWPPLISTAATPSICSSSGLRSSSTWRRTRSEGCVNPTA